MAIQSTAAPQRKRVHVGDEKNYGVSFAKELDTGGTDELLTGTQFVVDDGATGDLTISRVAFNAAAKVIEGVNVAIAKGVLFHVVGFQAGVTYTLLVTGVSDASPDPQTIVRELTIITDA